MIEAKVHCTTSYMKSCLKDRFKTHIKWLKRIAIGYAFLSLFTLATSPYANEMMLIPFLIFGASAEC